MRGEGEGHESRPHRVPRTGRSARRVPMAALARKDGEAAGGRRRPQPDALVRGGGEQERRVARQEAQLVHVTAVPLQHPRHRGRVAVDELDLALLAADGDDGVAVGGVDAPLDAVEILLLRQVAGGG